ncbi:esterase family protein [Humisphaera borealis]|uniref:Esterase family protein n=2 Tax=Humisphaera borealis TaxID=2807512 RepID=A0A7M2X456_9BACT|nr:esterase family protein [Humisphaera borealis]
MTGIAAAQNAPTPKPVENYPTHADAVRKEGVPLGKVIQMPRFADSKIYPGTERDWWIYVPAQYDGKTPACLAVFQDGAGPIGEKGDTRVPIVFDNLIHQKEMPVTIGVFINPGNDPKKNPPPAKGEKRATPFKASNRSVEYDTMSDAYSKYLIDEILPIIQKEYKITDDPNGRLICGNSSGGICAFTVAWYRPDAFRKVVSHVGSFTDIRGGHNYPPMIRKAPPKPIRVFLQDGSNDLDNQFGDWFLANQQMAKAFAYANRTADEAVKAGGKSIAPDRYDVKTVWGEGVHSGKHGGAIFPDTMRWIWRDYAGVKTAAR